MAGDPARATSVLLLGGGLANGLIALRLAQLRPEIHVEIVERADRLGGEHTWSFFETDVPPASRAWIEPLLAARWPSYQVRFPAHRRHLRTGYASISSDRLRDAVIAALPGRVTLNTPAELLSPRAVALPGGAVRAADVVIDGRGPSALPHLALGFQKFVGLEVELEADHDQPEPLIMDATVDQLDGYRFLYVLPFGPRRLLIEDTRYSDGPGLDLGALEAGALAYAAARGWRVTKVLRRENGVLPVAQDGDIAGHWASLNGVAASGLRAALFHPTTGYSLPFAVQLAEAIAALPQITAEAVAGAARELSTALWERGRFYRLLNRMLFRAAKPERRYTVLERFYRLPEPLIERFYAGETRAADRLRILAGKPPVPLRAALNCWREKGRA